MVSVEDVEADESIITKLDTRGLLQPFEAGGKELTPQQFFSNDRIGVRNSGAEGGGGDPLGGTEKKGE